MSATDTSAILHKNTPSRKTNTASQSSSIQCQFLNKKIMVWRWSTIKIWNEMKASSTSDSSLTPVPPLPGGFGKTVQKYRRSLSKLFIFATLPFASWWHYDYNHILACRWFQARCHIYKTLRRFHPKSVYRYKSFPIYKNKCTTEPAQK